jgi:uncharacterized membrane protein YqgA involved in biofilm formation
MKNEEALIQEAVINYLVAQYPKALYCASAGGVRTSMKQAVKMKKTGYVKGFPDIFIYQAKGSFFGLAIEMKTAKGVMSQSQKDWQAKLINNGYQAVTCKSFDEAKKVIDDYMAQ